MLQSPEGQKVLTRRNALCVGIGTYTNLINRDLRYAVDDATMVAERLSDPLRGGFVVTLLTESTQTTKAALDQAIKQLLSAPERQTEDLTLLYFSCHGDIDHKENTFCLLPSNTTLQANGMFEQKTLIGISDLARWFSQSRTHNIVLLMDVCHSGGAGVALQRFNLNLEAGPNYFILGSARQDQITSQSSRLKHGVFTYCLLRAFEQPPTKDGWLTISQIQNFVSDEIKWFTKDQPAEIQIWSVFVNPHLPLLRNPGYPELCPLPPFWNVPFQRNLFFTGQDDLLDQLTRMLQNEQQIALTQPYAISGLGGIGKTQLVLEYAYRHRQDYHAVFWSQADTRENLIASFVAIASLLDLPQKDEKDQMIIVESVKTWLKGRAGWLLILDNADELALVKEFIPPAFRGHLLLTTRARSLGGLAQSLEVETMDSEMGALLLLRRARVIENRASLDAAFPSDIALAKEIAIDLGGLPLALDQAGAYIEETECSLLDYQQRFQTRRAHLLQRRGGKVPDHPEGVATTWSLSFEKIEEKNPDAADLLKLCAYLAPDAIPENILLQGAEYLGTTLATTAADPLLLDRAIEALGAYSLLRRDRRTRLLSMHRLVQAVLRVGMSTEVALMWKQRAILAVNAASPDVKDVSQWNAYEYWMPHALVCAEFIDDTECPFLVATQLLTKSGSYLLVRAQYKQAEPLLQQALTIREQQLGPTHLETASSLDLLGLLYQRQGKYKKAEHLLQRALTIREQILGPSHPDIVQSLSNLGDFYGRQGEYKKAEYLLRRALSICEQAFGPIHPDTASSLNHLGWLYSLYAKHKEAELVFQRALTIDKQIHGTTHPSTIADLVALGFIYSKQARYKEAEPLLQEALAIREQLLGPIHPDTVQVLISLGWLYWSQARYQEAESLFKQALAACEQSVGHVHPDTAQSHLCLGMVYNDQGRYQEAEPLCQQAIAIYDQVFGLVSEEAGKALGIYALLLLKRGRIIKATQIGVRVLRALGMRVTLLNIAVVMRIYIMRVGAVFRIR
jgi:tetratricopeptide (TPR) repeat protein